MAQIQATISFAGDRDVEARFLFYFLENRSGGQRVLHYVDREFNVRTTEINKPPSDRDILQDKVGRLNSYTLTYDPACTNETDRKIKKVCEWLKCHPSILCDSYDDNNEFGINKSMCRPQSGNVKFNYNYLGDTYRNYIHVFQQNCEALDLYRTMVTYDEKSKVLMYFGYNPKGMTHSQMHFVLSNPHTGLLWAENNAGIFISNFKHGMQPVALTKILINKAMMLGIIVLKQGIGFTFNNEYIGNDMEQIAMTFAKNPELQVAVEASVAQRSLDVYDDMMAEEMPSVKKTTAPTNKKAKEVEA